jgi:hypothetical protein
LQVEMGGDWKARRGLEKPLVYPWASLDNVPALSKTSLQ